MNQQTPIISMRGVSKFFGTFQALKSVSIDIGLGERVVIWSSNSPEWVLMEYACALSGLVLVTGPVAA